MPSLNICYGWDHYDKELLISALIMIQEQHTRAIVYYKGEFLTLKPRSRTLITLTKAEVESIYLSSTP